MQSGLPARRKFALLITAWDDDLVNPNPILAAAGRVRYHSFVNDRVNMKTLLLEQAGFDRTCIYEFIAEQNTTPDDVRIWFGAMKQFCLREDSEAFVVVHYSGHGTFQIDWDGDEVLEPGSGGGGGGGGFLRRRKDMGKDEILAVHRNCMIVDDELHDLVDMGEKASVLAIFDCCHSGTIADLTFTYVAKAGIQNLVPKLARTATHSARTLGRVISFSGCCDKEEAQMSSLDDKTVGNLTKALLLAWREGGIDQAIAPALFPRVQATVQKITHHTQKPQLCASFEIAAAAMPFEPDSWVSK